jgi:hypothetical protein
MQHCGRLIRNRGAACLYMGHHSETHPPDVLVPEIRRADRARQRQAAADAMRPITSLRYRRSRALANRDGLPAFGRREKGLVIPENGAGAGVRLAKRAKRPK